jgi:hypothetical protein
MHKAMQMPLAGRERLQWQNVTSCKFNLVNNTGQRVKEKDHDMGPPSAIPERKMLPKSKSINTMKLPKREVTRRPSCIMHEVWWLPKGAHSDVPIDAFVPWRPALLISMTTYRQTTMVCFSNHSQVPVWQDKVDDFDNDTDADAEKIPSFMDVPGTA